MLRWPHDLLEPRVEFMLVKGVRTVPIRVRVCGNDTGEASPVFMGAPLKAHWGLPDPADVEGDEAAVGAAFEQTWHWLEMRSGAARPPDRSDGSATPDNRAWQDWHDGRRSLIGTAKGMLAQHKYPRPLILRLLTQSIKYAGTNDRNSPQARRL